MQALEIKEKIKYGLATAYMISGDDAILKEYVINNICSIVPADERDFSINTFEGVVNISDIINTAKMASFFPDSKRIILVKNYDKTLKSGDADKLLSYLEDPNDDCTILFIDCGKTFSAIADYCVPVNCDRASEGELKKYVMNILSSHGYTVSTREKGTLEMFIQMCNRDMGKLTQETEKLMLYCQQDKIIKKEDVKEIVSINTENSVFDLTDAIQKGEKDLALQLVDTMIKRGEKSSVLLALITNAFRKIFWVANTNASDEEMCKMLGMQQWLLNKTKKIVVENKAHRRGYIPYLKGILDMLYNLEYEFKSGKISQDAALRLAMTHLLV